MLRQLLLETGMTSYGPPQEQAGHNFSIAYKAGVELPDLSAEAAKALTGARRTIGRCLVVLERNQGIDRVKGFAETYLGVPQEDFRSELPTILNELRELKKKSESHLLLKITNRLNMNGIMSETANGKVRFKNQSKNKFKKFAATSADRFEVEDRGVKGFKIIAHDGYTSNITLRAGAFIEHRDIMSIIIIHELTHKFLGYNDGYGGTWYFGADGNEQPDLGRAPHTMLRRTADGMAWFIANVAGKMDHMDHLAINPPFGGCSACVLF